MPHPSKAHGGAWRSGGGADTGDGEKQKGCRALASGTLPFYVSML